MPSVTDFYQTESRWLKAEDLKGRKHKVRIKDYDIVEFEEKGQKKRKIGLSFDGKDKGLMLNKTNAKIVAKQHGQDMDDWVGKEINIYPTTTDYEGRPVECIRVEDYIPPADDSEEAPF